MSPKQIAAKLPVNVRRALIEKGAPIPDSLWFGKWSHLREGVPTNGWQWRWSPLGLAVRDALRDSGSRPEGQDGEAGLVRSTAERRCEDSASPTPKILNRSNPNEPG